MRKVLDFLSSRRVAVYFFLIFLLVSVLGALIPQKELPAFYEARYPAWLATLFQTLKLVDVYHSWYFVFLLLFLVTSLVTCTLRRLPRALKPLRRAARLPEGYDKLSLNAELGPAAGAGEAEARARKFGFRWRRVGDVFYGRRRPYALWGEVITHAGLVLIFVGAFLRAFGHRDTVFVFEGNGVGLPTVYGEGYEIWADEVQEVRDADSGRVLEFRTAARLLRFGEEVAAKEVEVNGPLHHGAIGVYQSNMDVGGATGLALDVAKMDSAEIPDALSSAAFEWTVGDASGTATAAPGQTVPLGDTGYQLRFMEYYENFITDQSGYRNDNPERNPTAFVNVVSPSGAAAMGILFELYPEFSIIKSSAEEFTKTPVVVNFSGDAGAGGAGKREYLAVTGTRLVLAPGREMEVSWAGDDTSARGDMAVEARFSGGEARLLPRGEWVTVNLGGDDYAVRFAGIKKGKLTGLTIADDPGITVFYAACFLLSLGVAGAMLISYDELFLYRRGGKVYLAARSSRGARLLRPAFERWVARIKEDI